MHLEDVAFCNTFATPSLKKKFATDEIVSNGSQINIFAKRLLPVGVEVFLHV